MKWATLHSHIPEIIAHSPEKERLAVERACVQIEARAKAHSAVRTGLMRSEWHHEMISDSEGRVYNLVRYTVYQEYGTRYMAPHPMLHPAITETTPEFAENVAGIFDWQWP